MTRLCFALSLLLCTIPFALAQENPVTNGGFETLGPNGLPVDWSYLGDVTVSNDAHSGKNAVLIRREKIELEAGLNRDWRPDSGEQGTMLSQLKGGIRFWYKAVSASDDAVLHFFVIPMGKRPMEDTGEARADFVVPKSHVGDGKWHLGLVAYDFTANPDVKWVHLSPRIMGLQAALLLDDVEWVENAGPVLAISGTRWEEDARKPGERATLAVRVKNIGDEPTSAATVNVTCPDYLRVAGQAQAPVPKLSPEDYTELRFVIEGRRDRDDIIGISATQPEGAPECSAEFRLEPKAEAIQLRADRFILARGETTTLRAIVRGEGTAITTGIAGKLELSDPAITVVEPPTGPVEAPPGREVALTWKVRAQQETASALAIARLYVGRMPLQDGVTELVVGAAARSAPDKTGAHVEGDTAWLQGQGLRLVVHRSSLGFGIADLQVKKRGWETVARTPSMGRIVIAVPGDVLVQSRVPLYGTPKAEGERLVVQCSHADDDGARWTATVTFALRDDGRNIGMASSLKCNRTAKLLAFDAPMLYVGEGSFGSAKDEALFPGLDWLDRDDVSSESENLLIAKGHPDQVRYVPHPQMITIPMMSVLHDGTCVGLLWDCRRKWDDSHDRPAAVFGSPDRFEGRNAHVMGLFVPSVAEEGKPWVRMNEREAWTPYDLPANREISLESVIYARTDAPDALAAMDEWFRIYGVPKPLPYPQGDLQKQLAFDMRAYLESLWVPADKEWWTSRGAGKLLSPKGRPLSFVHDLLKGAMILDDPLVKQRCKARADEVLGLAPGQPMWADTGFDYGRADEHLINFGVQAMGVIGAQGKDGSWRFDADQKASGIFKGMDYHRLGPDSAELGTCAADAYLLLKFARMSGEPRAYEAGVKALEFMEQYRVPRAAQVWEVMVHAPDILAAADAVDAYLEAYQYDGNRKWLDEAVRWGRGGLPFVYMWDDPEKPFLLGASIPVFGASWETGSWFGRPVQWNGLRHARALLKLARHDDSLPWKQLAECIIVSATYQQSTDDDDIALWPDSISAIDCSKSGWIFAPLNIHEPLYMLIGRQEEADTVILGKSPERIHLNSGADIQASAWENGAVTATLTYPSGESGYTVVVGVTRPETVLLDGAALTERSQLEVGDTPGWRYVAGAAMCTVRITGDGEHKLELRGIEYENPSLMPEPTNRIAFEFTNDAGGWMASNHIGALHVADGVLQVPITGGDPYMVRNFLSVDGNLVREIVIRMKAPVGQGAQFYWGTATAPGFAEARVINFPITADGQWHEYRLPVGDLDAWKGQTITGIRLDPLSPGVPGTTVEIDSIRGE